MPQARLRRNPVAVRAPFRKQFVFRYGCLLLTGGKAIFAGLRTDAWEWFVADIFEEVDEELKEENLKKLWDRYGRLIVVAVILLVGGVAAIKAARCCVQTIPSNNFMS